MQIIGVVLLICGIILPASFEEIDKENESKGRYPRQVTTGTGTGTAINPIRFNGRVVLRPVSTAATVSSGSFDKWAWLTQATTVQTSAPIQIITTRPSTGTGTGTNLGTGTFNVQLRPGGSAGTSGISTGTLGTAGTAGSTNLGTLTLNSRKGRNRRGRSKPRKHNRRSDPRRHRKRSMPRKHRSRSNAKRLKNTSDD